MQGRRPWSREAMQLPVARPQTSLEREANKLRTPFFLSLPSTHPPGSPDHRRDLRTSRRRRPLRKSRRGGLAGTLKELAEGVVALRLSPIAIIACKRQRRSRRLEQMRNTVSAQGTPRGVRWKHRPSAGFRPQRRDSGRVLQCGRVLRAVMKQVRRAWWLLAFARQAKDSRSGPAHTAQVTLCCIWGGHN